MLFASLFNKKAQQWINGRKNQLSDLADFSARHEGKNKIWIHSASFGEFEMAKPYLSILEKDANNCFIISFFSPSGFENIKFENPNYFKIYLPLDIYKKQSKLVDVMQPNHVVFIKYEFWFNLLRVLKAKQIPYYYTSLNLNKGTYLFKSYMKPFLELIKQSSKIYCHNTTTLEVLKTNGFNNTELFGDSRIPKALENKNAEFASLKWIEKRETLALGSLINSEFSIATNFINKHKSYNYIVALHDIEPKDIETFVSKIELSCSLYSQLKEDKSQQVLIVDTLGDLKYLYRFADLAYVGAGFEKGPHNVLEPLVYNLPVLCGPNISKFPMAQKLKKNKLLTIIESKKNFNDALTSALKYKKSDLKSAVETFFDQNNFGLSNLIKDLSD